jgi:hypothetical protein
MQNGWNYTDELHKGEPFHGSLGCIPRSITTTAKEAMADDWRLDIRE